MKDAVKEIPEEGAELALGGFAITRNPIAFVNELIRQRKRGLKLYQIIGSMDADLLVGAGCVKSYTYSGGSLDKFGKLNRVNRAIESGKIQVKEYSGLSISLRFLAGSLGIPFIPTKTLLGTDILRNLVKNKDKSVKVTTSPFTGEKIVLLRSLQVDYAVIHAQYADERGNVIIEGPAWDIELAKSAKKLFVTVEKVVSNEYMKQHPEKVAIPGIFTHAIIEAPYGAFPTSVYKIYDYEGDCLSKYAQINNNDDVFNDYLKKYILDTKNHFEFLEKTVDLEKLFKLQADPVFGYHVEGDNYEQKE
ncbi:MAG: CoA transferase subunit A [Candidatus Lokiarchaeota archaeon]|nr:CoA transferase subunit A [Candidatus Lokiarchaeota archaeon]